MALAPPTDVIVTGQHNTFSVVVSWTAAKGTATKPTYQLQYRLKGTTTWIAGATTQATSATLYSLLPAKTYEIRVVMGTSTSAILQVTTPSAGVAPGPATALAVTNLTSTTLTLSWTAPTSGTAPFTYQAQISFNAGSTWQNVGSSTSSTSVNVTALTPNTAYQFRVVASNATGSSTSAAFSVTTLAVLPGAPTGLTVLGSPGQSDVSLQWVAPTTGTPPFTYQIRYRITGTTPFTTGPTASGLSLDVTGLAFGTSYDLQVAAVNGVGTGPFSSTAVAVTAGAPVAPSQPTGVTVGTITATSVAVSWAASATGSQPITYTLQYRPAGSGAFTSNPAASGLSDTVTGLSPSTAYNFQIQASNTAGTATSAIVSATTIAAAPTLPSAPLGLTSGGISSTTATLVWSAPATGTPPLTYKAQYSLAGAGTWVDGPTVSVLTAQIVGLAASTAYDFRVAAINGAGTGPNSATYTATTTAGSGSTIVSWQPPGAAPIAFSNSNLTVTTSGAAAQGALSSSPQAAGKWSFEVTFPTLSASTSVGVANATFSPSTSLGTTANGIGLLLGPTSNPIPQSIRYNNTSVLTPSGNMPLADTAGATATFCVDLDARLMWVSTPAMRAAYGSAGTTLDPAKLTSNAGLSSGNLRFLTSSTAAATGQSTNSVPSGKAYYEVTVNTLPGGAALALGLGASTWQVGVGLGSFNSIGMYQDGSVFLHTGSLGTVGCTLSQGTIAAVAVDFSAKLLWIGNGTQWNAGGTANPATGVGGISFSIGQMTAPFVAAVAASTVAGVDVTFNFGASAFRYDQSGLGISRPTAFQSWNAVTTSAPVDVWNDSATANPATGVGGVPIGVTGPLFVAVTATGAGMSAVMNAGSSAFSRSVPSNFPSWGGNTTAVVIPGATTALVAGAPAATAVPLSWTAPTTGTTPFTYSMQYRLNGGSSWSDGGSATATNGTVSGLTPATAYDFQVFASNAAGSGAAAQILNITTSASTGLPGPPQNVQVGPQNGVGAPGQTQATVFWQEPLTGAPITGYIVQYRVHGQTAWQNFPQSPESPNGTVVTTVGPALIIGIIGTQTISVAFQVQGSINGYVSAPTLQYSLDNQTWNPLPNGNAVSSSVFTFNLTLATAGTYVLRVRDQNQTTIVGTSTAFSVGTTVTSSMTPLRRSATNTRYLETSDGQCKWLGASHVWINMVHAPPTTMLWQDWIDNIVRPQIVNGPNTQGLMRLWSGIDGTIWNDGAGMSPDDQCVFLRSSTPGEFDGGNKFDLTQFNPNYFSQLFNLVSYCGQFGIHVQVMLFMGNFDSQIGNSVRSGWWWNNNNINGSNPSGPSEQTQINASGASAACYQLQLALTDKYVRTLYSLPNVTYEIVNEVDPRSGTKGFVNGIAAQVRATETSLGGVKHLIMNGAPAAWLGYDWDASANPSFNVNTDYNSPGWGDSEPYWGQGNFGIVPAGGPNGNQPSIMDTDHTNPDTAVGDQVWRALTRGFAGFFGMDTGASSPVAAGITQMWGSAFNSFDPSMRLGIKATMVAVNLLRSLNPMQPSTSISSTSYGLVDTSGGQFLIYQPNGGSAFTVNLSSQSGKAMTFTWVDGNNANILTTGTYTATSSASQSFSPPGNSGSACLVLVTNQVVGSSGIPLNWGAYGYPNPGFSTTNDQNAQTVPGGIGVPFGTATQNVSFWFRGGSGGQSGQNWPGLGIYCTVHNTWLDSRGGFIDSFPNGWAAEGGPFAPSTGMVPLQGIITCSDGSNHVDYNSDQVLNGSMDSLISSWVTAWSSKGYNNMVYRLDWEWEIGTTNQIGDVSQAPRRIQVWQYIHTKMHQVAAAQGVTIYVGWNPCAINYTPPGYSVSNIYPGRAFCDMIQFDLYAGIAANGDYPTWPGYSSLIPGSAAQLAGGTPGPQAASMRSLILGGPGWVTADPMWHWFDWPNSSSGNPRGGSAVQPNGTAVFGGESGWGMMDTIHFAKQQNLPLGFPECGYWSGEGQGGNHAPFDATGNYNVGCNVSGFPDTEFAAYIKSRIAYAQSIGVVVHHMSWNLYATQNPYMLCDTLGNPIATTGVTAQSINNAFGGTGKRLVGYSQ